MDAYSFFKHTDEQEEKHIFVSKFNANKETCPTPTGYSLCSAVKPKAGKHIKDAICLTEQEAREKAAHIGRSVCGNCVRELYTSYENM